MLKNCTITEASGFMPGSLHTMLGTMGVMPTQISPPAATPIVYSAQMTDEQINHFRLRGFSHKLEVEETPVVDPRDARIAQLEAERENWQDTAEQEMRNTQYYRGLLVEIGELIGGPAYIADDGSVSDSVLCAKVPELVKVGAATLTQALETATREIESLKTQLVSATQPAPSNSGEGGQ